MNRLLSGLTVRMLDLLSKGCEFDSRSVQWLLLGWVTVKRSWFITNIKVNSVFHLFEVGKWSTSLFGWG